MQAVLVTTVFAMFSMLMPPLSGLLVYVSGGCIALVTLQVGVRQGLMVTAGAAVGAAVMALVAQGTPQVALIFALVLWVPVWVSAAGLLYTRSLGSSLQLSALLGVMVVLLIFALMGDPAPMVLEVLGEIQRGIEQAGQLDSEQAQQIEQLFAAIAPLAAGLFAASLMVGLVLSLFIGRGWQALLYRPGAFGDEFNRMRFGKLAAIVTLVLVVLGLSGVSGVVPNLVIVLGTAYMFYGLAVMHGMLRERNNGSRWLFALYVLMLIAPQVAILLVLLGLADTWVDFRGRFAVKAGKS